MNTLPGVKTKDKEIFIKTNSKITVKGGNRAYRRKMSSVDRHKKTTERDKIVNSQMMDQKELRQGKVALRIKKVKKRKAIREEKNPVKKVKLTKKLAKIKSKNKAHCEKRKLKNEKNREIKRLKNNK